MVAQGRKNKNPFNLFSWKWYGFQIYWGGIYRTIKQNVMVLRGVIQKYVEDRKSGKRKSKVDKGNDLLNLFLENKEVFTDKLIVDEIMDFFAAAALTTMNTSQVIMTHFIKSQESLERVRAEFDEVFKRTIEEKPSLANLDKGK